MPKNEGSRPLFWLCGERPTRCSAERGGRIASGEIERPSQPLRSTKTYHRKGMRGIKRPVDKKLLSGLFAILIQIVSFLQWRRNRLYRSYFFTMKSNQRGEGGREEDNWDECELYPKSDELLSKFLSSSLCFIQMPPKTLKIVWTEPSHVRFKERSKLLASVKV